MQPDKQSANWRRVTFADLVGLRRDTIHPNDAGDLKYVGLEHIDSGNTRLSRWGDASEVKSAKNRFYPQDIIYGKLRPYLDKAVLVDEPGICSTDILVFEPKALVVPEFVAYLVHTQAFLAHAIATTAGVNHPRTSWRGLSDFPVALPPLEEQKALTAVLRTVQEAIAARRRETAMERERKAALMQRLFTYGTRGERLKDTAVGQIPESWQIRALGEMARITSGGTPSRMKPEYWNGKIPWVKTAEIDYKVINSTEETISELGMQNSSAKMIPKGTLLMAMYGQGVTRGRVGILGIDATVNQACAAILLSDSVFTFYLFYYLAYHYESIRNLGHGANQKNLNAQLIKSIPILLPPLAEQTTIANILAACDAKIAALEKESALLNELFQALLEELMSGRLRV